MKLQSLSESQNYFEISNYILRGNRLEFVKIFLEILVALPLALLSKIWRTALKAAGVLMSGLFLALTLGVSKGLRELFVSRVSAFAANLADWILLPIALAICLTRLVLASVIHPSLFIRH